MSFHEKTEELVNRVCMLEYSQATEKHGMTFNSMHEAWAVLKEEVEESECELALLKSDFKIMWEFVKTGNRDNVVKGVNIIRESAIKAIMELAQVWAVCEKMKG